MIEIELGDVCPQCASDWVSIYTKSPEVAVENIHYKLVIPKNCEECEGESEECEEDCEECKRESEE